MQILNTVLRTFLVLLLERIEAWILWSLPELKGLSFDCNSVEENLILYYLSHPGLCLTTTKLRTAVSPAKDLVSNMVIFFTWLMPVMTSGGKRDGWMLWGRRKGEVLSPVKGGKWTVDCMCFLCFCFSAPWKVSFSRRPFIVSPL